MVVTSNRDTAEWLAMFDDVLLAQSAVDRFRNSADDFVVEGESYRPRLKPTIEDADPPPEPRDEAARAQATNEASTLIAPRHPTDRLRRFVRVAP